MTNEAGELAKVLELQALELQESLGFRLMWHEEFGWMLYRDGGGRPASAEEVTMWCSLMGLP